MRNILLFNIFILVSNFVIADNLTIQTALKNILVRNNVDFEAEELDSMVFFSGRVEKVQTDDIVFSQPHFVMPAKKISKTKRSFKKLSKVQLYKGMIRNSVDSKLLSNKNFKKSLNISLFFKNVDGVKIPPLIFNKAFFHTFSFEADHQYNMIFKYTGKKVELVFVNKARAKSNINPEKAYNRNKFKGKLRK